MKAKLLLAILTVCTLFACKKDKDEELCTVTMASIANTYKLVGSKYKASASASEQDFLAFQEPCEKDDVIVFSENGTVEYKDINVQCSPNGSYTDTWSLNGNNITIDGDVGVVQSYDCNTLVVTGSNVIIPGDMITYTFQKQ